VSREYRGYLFQYPRETFALDRARVIACIENDVDPGRCVLLTIFLRDIPAVSITVIFRLAERERRIPTLEARFCCHGESRIGKSSRSSGELEIDLTPRRLLVYSMYSSTSSALENILSPARENIA